MQKVMDPYSDFFSTLKDSYKIARSRPNFEVFPQMPLHQIRYFVKQAVRKEKEVVIQLNPSPHDKKIKEIIGKITLSHRSSHVILKPSNEQTVHLIRPHLIRHLRLA